MAHILIVYSTHDGHTREICQHLQGCLEKQSHQVTLLDFRQCEAAQIAAADKIVIGASIRYGRHNPLLLEFISRNRQLLESRANAFFSVNVVARKAEKNTPETNPYLRKFLQKTLWRPQRLAVFAGKIDYPKYGFIDRSLIQLIMLITHGPTDCKGTFEFTDWSQVDAFGAVVAAL